MSQLIKLHQIDADRESCQSIANRSPLVRVLPKPLVNCAARFRYPAQAALLVGMAPGELAFGSEVVVQAGVD